MPPAKSNAPPIEEQTIAVPHHVGDREVDERHPENREEDNRGEFDPFGKRADDQGRRNRGEGHLEGDEDVLGYDLVSERRRG